MTLTRVATEINQRKRKNATNPHLNTPQKARIRQAYTDRKEMNYYGLRSRNHSFKAAYEALAVSKTSAYRTIREARPSDVDRTIHNARDVDEPRGRPRTITPSEIHEMERIIKESDAIGRSMTWLALGRQAGLEDVSERTIRRTLGRMDYHKCVACLKTWISSSLAQQRVDFADYMLRKYPFKHDWWRVRFSDEVHFGVGPMGKLMIIRKPGERYCINCIQEQHERDRIAEKQKVHVWAAIGHDFKSDIHFYDIPSNNNGKMTTSYYVDHILEPLVKPWIIQGHDFVLEEDRDSGHGISKTNTPTTRYVKAWKESNNLKYYFNCSGSPDLSPIENCWQPTKHYIRKEPHWDRQDTRNLAQEGWDRIEQKWINKKVDEMPERLLAVIRAHGKASGY